MELCSVAINILIVSNSARAELIHRRAAGGSQSQRKMSWHPRRQSESTCDRCSRRAAGWGHWLTAFLRPRFSVRASCRAILPRIRTSVNQAFRGGGPGVCRAEPSCAGPTPYPIGRLLRLPTKRGVDATSCWGNCVVASERDQCGAGYVAIRQHDQHLLVQTVSTTQRDRLRSAQ